MLSFTTTGAVAGVTNPREVVSPLRVQHFVHI
jgi:hypothetical protein